MRSIKKLSIPILLFWVFMMGLLIKKTYFSSEKLIYGDFHLPGEEQLAREDWMGVYIKDQKIGYARTSIERESGGYRISDKLFLQLMMMGSYKKVDVTVKSRVGKDFSLKSFDFCLRSGLTVFRATGKIVGKRLKLRIITGDEQREEMIPLPNTPHLSSGISPLIAQSGMKIGEKYSLSVFDPLTFTQRKIAVEVEDKEKVAIGGRWIPSYRIRTSFDGFSFYSWINDKGERLKEKGLMGLTLIREDRETALRTRGKGGVSVDFIALGRISSNIRIENVDRLKFLRVCLKNISLASFILDGQRQRLEGGILEVRREGIENLGSFKIPYKKDDQNIYLLPTPLVQSKSDKLIKEAEKIIGDERDAFEVVRLFLRWILKNIEKRPTLSVPSALEVLKLRVGDCNEHATLFTAFCRAAGIPARICAGIIYSEGYFYYHAWSEVYLNQWVSVDPLLNQFPADVTHIKFVEGELESQQEIAKIMGKLELKVLEYR